MIGTNHSGDSVSIDAKVNLSTAFTDAAGRTPFTTLAGSDLTGLNLTPGVYRVGAITPNLAAGTTLTLDGQGDTNAVFIFQSSSTLITGASSNVVLVNGTQARNVFWQVGSAATLGATSTFNGTIMAYDDISIGTGAQINGRLLAGAQGPTGAGAVTLIGNNVTNPSYSGVIPVNFVTSDPIRMLNETGAATKIPTSVYYYYNGSNISINVSLNQSDLNVSGDFSLVGNSSLINTSTSVDNGSGEYIYTLTANNVSASMGGYPINITATNTSTSAYIVSNPPPIALMNINPQAIDLTLGGTNWTTGIPDFTNATLTFEKFNETGSKIGTLEFLDPMNLANTTTATALQNLGDNLNISAASMNLSSAADALFAMNVSSRLSAYNLTNFTTYPAIFMDGVLIALPDNSSGGAASDISWNQTTQTLTLNVSHWTTYSWGTFGINLTNISALSNTTTAGTNATYTMSLENNGTVNDTYTLDVVDGGASTANLSVGSPLFVAAGATETFTLNVTNGAPGTFLVNVTATSTNYSNRTASINTTTEVTSAGAPNITSFAPASPVNDTAGASRTFNITANQTVNVTWLINGTFAQFNESVMDANYTNITAAEGIWNVTAIANNTNGTVSQTWDWNVTALPSNSSQAPVALGAAGNFTVLAGTAVTCTGTTINGDVGVSPGTVLTACTVVGTNHTNDSFAIAANSSFLSAYDDVKNNVTVDGALTGTLASITLLPGAYSFDTAGKTGTLTLNADGNTSAVWIFKSAVSTGYLEATNFNVVMANGGNASNVYWWVDDYATMTTSNFQGTILAGSAITITGGTFNGSALAKAAVTMTNTVVTGPSAPSYNVNLTNVSAQEASTVAGTNATYYLNLTNNGTAADSYNLTIDNLDNAGIAEVNISTTLYSLAAGATKIFTLNVSNTTAGTFLVNVTATSTSNTSKFMSVNTTTTVTAPPSYNVSLTNVTALSNTTTGANATYVLNLTNNGTGADSYTLTVANPNGASTAGINISSPYPLGAGVSQIFTLNVTHTISGTFVVNVTATSLNGTKSASISTTTTVNRTSNTSLNFTPGTFNVNETINITSPSGNVTVTIPNGTNASKDGAALTSITADSLAKVNSTFTLAGNDKFIGENLSMGPEGAIFSPDIQIRFNYTDAQLTAAGITDESTLKVQFYNTSSSPAAWETLSPYEHNMTGNYTIVNVSHFSTFALLGTTTTSGGGDGGTGGGGGGGSSGVTTSEPYDNIAKAERYDKALYAGKPVTYTFTAPEHGVYEIVVTGEENEYDIALRVEALKGTSKLVSVSPPGTVYKNLNVWAGTKRIKDALIRFKVDNSWLTSSNIAPGNVKMMRWESGKWVQLDTTQGTKDNSFTYYEAKTGGFSVFAIVGLKEGEVVPTATPKPTGVTTPVGEKTPVTEATEKESPGFGAISVVSAMVLMAALYMRKRERR